ncbi:hypothetical protein ANCDUO_27510 [Ancylostoma duodenale]|uniref:Peptidase M41 FtsH extracellular domain-containing protein n=1 Tax=Ancylostoma duodenale TaxID=51022 RepID=A0A0C2F1W5_9BILA|nr:hypothetical protein ANCDUO_27510 [Ancylostoma duodenale]
MLRICTHVGTYREFLRNGASNNKNSLSQREVTRLLQKDAWFEERFLERVRETVSWFATPRGFKKFFDSDGGKSTEKEKKSTSDEKPKSSDSKKAKGGGGSPGGPLDQFPGGWQQIAISVGLILALYLFMDYQSYREISWKEFFHEFLEPGIVDRLEVVDKRWVRIVSSAKSGGQERNPEFDQHCIPVVIWILYLPNVERWWSCRW